MHSRRRKRALAMDGAGMQTLSVVIVIILLCVVFFLLEVSISCPILFRQKEV